MNMTFGGQGKGRAIRDGFLPRPIWCSVMWFPLLGPCRLASSVEDSNDIGFFPCFEYILPSPLADVFVVSHHLATTRQIFSPAFWKDSTAKSRSKCTTIHRTPQRMKVH